MAVPLLIRPTPIVRPWFPFCNVFYATSIQAVKKLLYGATMDATLAHIEWKAIALGPLPVMIINRCLRLELRAGDVMFSADAQKHAYKRKPERYPICCPHYQDVIASPTHVGQQPGYEDDGFDLVKIMPGGTIILMGIGLRPMRKSGIYTVRSVYPLDKNTLERRVRVGTTMVV